MAEYQNIEVDWVSIKSLLDEIFETNLTASEWAKQYELKKEKE
jgi:hypothetical protein